MSNTPIFATNDAAPASDEVRIEELAGKPHLVAPVVLVREGVLNGGFLSAEEIQSSAPGWNNVPVTAPPSADVSGHPMDGDEFTTANTVDNYEQYVIGKTFNVEYDDELDGLVGEMWLDIQRAKQVGETALDVLERLNDGEALEVSTGYWHGWEERTGTHNGDTYEEVQFDLMPDHLATLPNETGACSWEDGCGAPRVNQLFADSGDVAGATSDASFRDRAEQAARILMGQDTAMAANCDGCGGACSGGGEATVNANPSPRTPEFSGTTSASRDSWSEVDLTFAAFRDAYAEDNPDAVDWTDLSASDRTRISARSINGEPEADTFDEGLVLPVVDPSTDELHEGGLVAALQRAPQTEGINTEETQSRIRSLLESEFDRDMEDADTANTNMSDSNDGPDFDFEDLAEQSAFEADYLSDNPEVAEKVHETVVAAQEAAADAADDGTDDTDADDGGNADAQNADSDEPDASDDGMTAAEERIEALEEKLDALSSQREQEERQPLVDTITSNTEYTEDDLDSMDRDSLELLAEMAENQQEEKPEQKAGVNYLGRGTPTSNAESEDDGDLDGIGALSTLSREEAGD